MKYLRWILFGSLLYVGAAYAQQQSQTSVACATGASPVAGANQCIAGQTYGVSLGSQSVEFLHKDTTRNGLWVQNSGANTACIKFEMDGSPANLTTPQDCINVPTGQPMYFSNFNQGTVSGKGIISGVAGISAGGTQITFMFMEQ